MKQESKDRRTVFIVNSNAGTHKAGLLVSEIRDQWTRHCWDFEIVCEKTAEEARVVAENALKNGFNEVAVLGGDGTLLSIADLIVKYKCRLGIVPFGSGNDLAKTLRVSSDQHTALERIVESKNTSNIDVGCMNGKLFLNVSSIGIDAAVVKRAMGIRRFIKGSAGYFLAALIEIFSFKPFEIEIEDEAGNDQTKKVLMVAVANGCYYGGGMNVAPEADVSDQMYDMIILEPTGRLRLIQLFSKIYYGTHIYCKEVTCRKVKRVRAKVKYPVLLNRDGDIEFGERFDCGEIRDAIEIIK